MTYPPDTFLDSYKNNRNRFCGSWSVAGKIEKDGRQYGHIARLGCKRWDCPECGPKRARQLRKAIIDKAEERKLQRFLTLTLDPRRCSAEESTKHLRETWAKMRTYFKRKYGQSIDFISVTELQKNGYAHLHVLVDRYIPQQWVQQSWGDLGGGRFVNIKFVDVHRIAAYLSKYLTKEIFLSHFKPGTRRFTTSRSIKLFVKPPKGSWELVKNSIENIWLTSGSEVAVVFCDENGVLQWFRFEIV